MEQETNPHILKIIIVLILISNILQLKNSYLHILLYDDLIKSQRFKKSTIIMNMMCILTLVIDRNSIFSHW